MKNIIPAVITVLLTLMEKVINGATQYGAAIGLLQNTGLNIRSDVDPLIEANRNYEEGKTALADKRRVVRSVYLTCREFVRVSRDTLRPRFGTLYSESWNILGFVGSLRLPRNANEAQPMLRAISAYFVAHPEFQNSDLDMTSTRADGLLASLLEAQNAAITQEAELANLLKIRGEKALQVKKRLRCVIAELDLKIGALDTRWLAFGLKQPGLPETPEVPANVRVVVTGLSAEVTWGNAPRADHYRIWLKVVGVDENPRAIGSVADAPFRTDELPANSTMEISLSAVNTGGESQRSNPVSVTTH
jgi:hypothetical protein